MVSNPRADSNYPLSAEVPGAGRQSVLPSHLTRHPIISILQFNRFN